MPLHCIAIARVSFAKHMHARLEAKEEGLSALEIGCGNGYATNLLARAFPSCQWTGFDLLPDQVKEATNTAADWGLNNVAFSAVDLSDLSPDTHGRFDLICGE